MTEEIEMGTGKVVKIEQDTIEDKKEVNGWKELNNDFCRGLGDTLELVLQYDKEEAGRITKEPYKIRMIEGIIHTEENLNFSMPKEGQFSSLYTAPQEVILAIRTTPYGGRETIQRKTILLKPKSGTGGKVTQKQILEKLPAITAELISDARKKAEEVKREHDKKDEKPKEIFLEECQKVIHKFEYKDDPTSPVNINRFRDTLVLVDETIKTLPDIVQTKCEINVMREYTCVVGFTENDKYRTEEHGIRMNMSVFGKTEGEEAEISVGCCGGLESLYYKDPVTGEEHKTLENVAKALGEAVVQKIMEKKKAEKFSAVIGSEAPCVLYGRASCFLWAGIMPFFSGDSMYKNSFEVKEKLNLVSFLGSKVGPDDMNITVNGMQRHPDLDIGLYGASIIDGEGTPTREVKLVEDGRLLDFLSDRVTFLPVSGEASIKSKLLKSDHKLTGSSRWNKLTDKPVVAPSNIFVSGGTGAKSADSLAKTLTGQTGIFIVDCNSLEYDIGDGEIKLGISQAYVMSNGIINYKRSITSGTLKLNVSYLARSDYIREIGNKDTIYGTALTLEIDGVTVPVYVEGPGIAIKTASFTSVATRGSGRYNVRFHSQGFPTYLTKKRDAIVRRELALPEDKDSDYSKSRGMVVSSFQPKEMRGRRLTDVSTIADIEIDNRGRVIKNKQSKWD